VSSIRDFFVKVNQDPKFRAQFLDSPTEVIKQYGIEVSKETEAELEEIMPIVRKHLPDLAKIPMGYTALLDEVARKKRHGHTKDPVPLII
jgi:hypothetical protein